MTRRSTLKKQGPEGNAESDELAAYKALVDRRVRELFEVVAGMSVLDFSRRVPVPPPEDPFYELALGLNLTLEGLAEYTRGEVEHRERKLAAYAGRLEGLNRRLQETNTQLDDFAYTVSHDLREPLRGIEALGTYLLEDYGDDLPQEAKDYLARMQGNAVRMRTMLDGILRYSRATRTDEEPESVDLEALVNEVLEGYGVLMRKRHASVHIQSPLLQVEGYPVRLHEVFANLIANAIRYNDTDHPEITLCTRGPVEGRVECIVEDNGPGVAPEYRDVIFQLFRRGPTAGAEEGSGAGLAIVKKIVEQHGGRIWVEDAATGRGAAFHFTLPAAGRDLTAHHEMAE